MFRFLCEGHEYIELNNIKAHTLPDKEEKYLTSDEESKAQCTRKANKCKAMSCFNAELCQQADVEVQSIEELYTEEAQII